MPESLTRKSIAEQTAELIENEIIEGNFLPGQRLLEESLSSMWNISRSPIREAMRILTGKGFLIFKPRKGTFVAPLTREELENLYTIRANLESLAISLTIKKHADIAIKEMQEIQNKIITAVKIGDLQTYKKLNILFHDAYIKHCGNQQLIDILCSLASHIQRYRNKTMLKRGFPELLANHEHILKLMHGDPDVAAEARKQRILSNISLILKDF